MLLIGDFNAPWESMSLFTNRIHIATHSSLTDVMQEHRLVNQPTQHQNILNLFFLNHPDDKFTVDILVIMILFVVIFKCSTK